MTTLDKKVAIAKLLDHIGKNATRCPVKVPEVPKVCCICENWLPKYEWSKTDSKLVEGSKGKCLLINKEKLFGETCEKWRKKDGEADREDQRKLHRAFVF